LKSDIGTGNFALRVRPLLACNVKRIARNVPFTKWHALLESDGLMLGKSAAGSTQRQQPGQPKAPVGRPRIFILHVWSPIPMWISDSLIPILFPISHFQLSARAKIGSNFE